MARSPFIVNIAELRRERALPKPFAVSAAVDWHVELSKVLPDPPLEADLLLAPVPGGILASGEVRAVVEHICYRCLGTWTEDVAIPVSELFVDGPDDDDADYVVEGVVVDVEPLLRDEVLLSMPVSPTCRPDCPGVVVARQTGLNEPVPGQGSDANSPFAVLRDLLDTGD